MEDNIQWFKRRPSGRIQSESYVRVSIVKKNGDRKSLTFTFTNMQVESLFKVPFLVIGICDNRIYFREEKRLEAYKLRHESKYTWTLRVTIDENEIILFKPFLGNFFLNFDNEKNMYYIEGKI